MPSIIDMEPVSRRGIQPRTVGNTEFTEESSTMSKRRITLTALLAAPLLAFIGALSILASPALQAQTAPASTSGCLTGPSKSVDPSVVQQGDTARVTMILTHTCPAERKPVDLVFVVDVSNSMTRGGPAKANDPDPGNGAVPDPGTPKAPEPPKDPLAGPGSAWSSFQLFSPDQNQPPIDPPSDPGNSLVPPPSRPGAEPSGCVPNDAANQPGPPSNSGGTPTAPGPQPPPPPGPGLSTPPSNNPGDPGTGPGVGVGKGDSDEAAGSEDLLRDAQRWLRDVMDEPVIKDDLEKGLLRLGLVSFNERGRRLLSLSDDGKRTISRLGLLRGGGLTRVDLGMRSAEQVFRLEQRGQLKRDDSRVKLVVLISDGQFCTRDIARARAIDKDIIVIAVAAGRGANERKLRDIASEREYLLQLRDLDIKELISLYSNPKLKDPIRQLIPVAMKNLTIRDELGDGMELVPGSVNPAPAVINGQTIEWTLPDPTSPFTIEYEVKPLEAGIHDVSKAARAEWTDTSGKAGSADYPAVSIELIP
jgi:hypothetical protein